MRFLVPVLESTNDVHCHRWAACHVTQGAAQALEYLQCRQMPPGLYPTPPSCRSSTRRIRCVCLRTRARRPRHTDRRPVRAAAAAGATASACVSWQGSPLEPSAPEMCAAEGHPDTSAKRICHHGFSNLMTRQRVCLWGGAAFCA